MKTVVIVQRRLTNYRVPLFEALHDVLAARHIRLELLVGKGTPDEEKKRDAGKLSWAIPVPTHDFANGRLCWQPIYRHLNPADLVAVTQENALLANHLLIWLPHRYKITFWGHGANLQSVNPNGFKERYKRWTTPRVDWWFAYTQMSADFVKTTGFPSDRITVLNNAVDTTELRTMRESVTANETRALRDSLGFGDGPVGVFLGSLYPNKRLDFLFSAAAAIRREISGFHLLIVGDGPDWDKVRAWCNAHSWARWVGARFGREKLPYLSTAQVMLNPGLVGLGIVDAFACELPMITTDCGIHSPEIVYLDNGRNGVMTSDDLASYVEASVRLLHDDNALDVLRAGCALSASEYTLENMVRRFAEGIESALSLSENRK